MKTKSDWLERLMAACSGVTDEQAKKIIEYSRWVKIQKINGEFEELFSKSKNGPFRSKSEMTG